MKTTPPSFIKITGIGLLLCILSIGGLFSLNPTEKTHAIASDGGGVETTFPTRATPNPTQDITDLDHWIATLPYQQDQTAAGYVVYPKAGITIPLVRPDDSDFKKIQIGELFNHYKYLEEGALHYMGTAPDQGIGNMVLAVHSSFDKSDPGRYKTAGQAAPISNVGDKIFVYLADEQGMFTLYIYEIHRSEQIPDTEVSILKQDVTAKSLTLFTCYPIGTTDARWVNQAILIDTMNEEEFASTNNQKSDKESFTTQSLSQKDGITTNNTVPKKTHPTQTAITAQEKTHTAAPLSGNTELSGSLQTDHITPTFKERVVYRPVAYKTTMKLISLVGFKRVNLQKLTEGIDRRIGILAPAGTHPSEQKRKTAVIFLMIKEIIEGFMG